MRSIVAAFPVPGRTVRNPSGIVATIRILTAARQSRIRTGFPDPAMGVDRLRGEQ